MEQPLYRFLEKKLALHTRKHRLLVKIREKEAYWWVLRDFQLLRVIIAKEIILNNQILKRIGELNRKLSKLTDEPFFSPVEYYTRAVIKTLKQEAGALSDITLLDISLHNIAHWVKKESKLYFDEAFTNFKLKYNEELKQNLRYSVLMAREERKLSKVIKQFSVEREKFFEEKGLYLKAQDNYKKLVKAIGNEEEVRKRANDLLTLVSKIKGTKVYDYMQQDVSSFEKKIRYIMQHPKDNKAAYVLASAYIIAPATFEATFIILFVRYLGKYIIHKTKKKKGLSF